MARYYPEHRVKTYAVMAIKKALRSLTAKDLNFTDDFNVEFKEDLDKKDTMYLHIKDPSTGLEILSIKVSHVSR